MEPILEAKKLNLWYGPNHALHDVSIAIPEHEITAFIGPSGCGKSTFLRTLNRMNDLIPGVKLSGEVDFHGQDLYGSSVDPTWLRKQIGMVFQKANPFPMSIYDNVAYGPRTHGIRNRVKLDEIVENSLRSAAIWDEVKDRLKKSALGLSGGQQQRLCIARFFAKLDSMLEVTARQLHERMEFQKTAFAKQFPLLMSALWIGSEKLKPNDTIASVINQGTLGIGFIGLAECLVALLGKHHGESGEAQELGLKIVTYMRDRANQFSEQYQHNYSVLATPAEGLSGKFTRIDRKKFGTLPGITDRDYYTNSNHVPVYYKCSARHKAEVEAPYHELTRGGHIFYVEIDGDATHNPEVIMRVVDMMDQYNIGYGSVNHNRNRCLECGHENSTPNLEECPKCGSKHIDKLQRITGYLVGTTDRWNNAKLAELNDRVVHN